MKDEIEILPDYGIIVHMGDDDEFCNRPQICEQITAIIFGWADPIGEW